TTADKGGNSPTDAAEEHRRQRLRDGAGCLAAALDYLRRGWPVTCCCPPDHIGVRLVNPDHARTCTSWGKTPWHRWKDLQERLPTEAEVRKWWRRLPTGNVGVALGGISRLVRVDVDGARGAALLAELARGDLPATLEFRRGAVSRGL